MLKIKKKQTLFTILFVAIAAVAIGGWLDDKGSDYTEATFNRALVAFGIAKGLNGVISVAQGTEVALQPAGVGVNFTPGEILDPINDLIEQFSWIMLASTASLGVQRILLNISIWPWFSGFVILLLMMVIISYWYKPLQKASWRPLLFKTMLVFVFLRFSVPLIAIGGEMVYSQFLAEQYIESSQHLEQTTDRITQINKVEEQQASIKKNKSILDSVKHIYSSTAAAMDIDARIEQYKQAASDATKHAINLIVVFIFQTILFPLLFLLVVYQFLKQLIRLKWMGLGE
jgi:hypothetical protein